MGPALSYLWVPMGNIPPYLPMGNSPPWASPLWASPMVIQYSTHSSRVCPSHRVQFCRNCLLQRGSSTSSASRPAAEWAPLSVGPQVLPRAYSHMGFLIHTLLQASTCSGVGSCRSCMFIFEWCFFCSQLICDDVQLLTVVLLTFLQCSHFPRKEKGGSQGLRQASCFTA